MTERAPIECHWDNDGQVFRPTSPYQARRAAKDYGDGEVVRLVELPERSTASHQHFFASVEDAHASLPPLMAERFPSPEHLRKYALVKSGHCYSDSMVCSSHAEAARIASFVRARDEFSLVTVSKNVVTRYVPKSQSYRSMGKEEFAKSKDDVLRVIAELLDVSKSELSGANAA